jgi:hypothetical protein
MSLPQNQQSKWKNIRAERALNLVRLVKFDNVTLHIGCSIVGRLQLDHVRLEISREELLMSGLPIAYSIDTILPHQTLRFARWGNTR